MKIPLKKMNHAEHKKAWLKAWREVPEMDIAEIEGGKEKMHWSYKVLFILVVLFTAFQVIRSLV